MCNTTSHYWHYLYSQYHFNYDCDNISPIWNYSTAHCIHCLQYLFCVMTNLGRTRCCQICLHTQHRCGQECLSSGVKTRLDSHLVAAHHGYAKHIETWRRTAHPWSWTRHQNLSCRRPAGAQRHTQQGHFWLWTNIQSSKIQDKIMKYSTCSFKVHPSIIISPFQCLTHWSQLSQVVGAEGDHIDTGCPSCHPRSAAEDRSHCRKDTSLHQAPGSAASPVHGQTHELPLVRDQCLNRWAEDKGRVILKWD